MRTLLLILAVLLIQAEIQAQRDSLDKLLPTIKQHGYALMRVGDETKEITSDYNYGAFHFTDLLWLKDAYEQLAKKENPDHNLLEIKSFLVGQDPFRAWFSTRVKKDASDTLISTVDLVKVQMNLGSDAISDYMLTRYGVKRFAKENKLNANTEFALYGPFKKLLANLNEGDLNQIMSEQLYGKLQGMVSSYQDEYYETGHQPKAVSVELPELSKKFYPILMNAHIGTENFLGFGQQFLTKTKENKKVYKVVAKKIGKKKAKALGYKKVFKGFFEYTSLQSGHLYYNASFITKEKESIDILVILPYPYAQEGYGLERAVGLIRKSLSTEAGRAKWFNQ